VSVGRPDTAALVRDTVQVIHVIRDTLVVKRADDLSTWITAGSSLMAALLGATVGGWISRRAAREQHAGERQERMDEDGRRRVIRRARISLVVHEHIEVLKALHGTMQDREPGRPIAEPMFNDLRNMRADYLAFRESLDAFESLALEYRVQRWYGYLFRFGDAAEISDQKFRRADAVGPMAGDASAWFEDNRVWFTNELNYAKREGAAIAAWMDNPTGQEPPQTPMPPGAPPRRTPPSSADPWS